MLPSWFCWSGAIPPLQVLPEDLLEACDLRAGEVLELAILLRAIARVVELLAKYLFLGRHRRRLPLGFLRTARRARVMG